ncbi:MAG: hypothetical protein M3070_10105 [Actinomycetota bacterium]|nr:hypothetical protein [Actinomycetota bacterium]
MTDRVLRGPAPDQSAVGSSGGLTQFAQVRADPLRGYAISPDVEQHGQRCAGLALDELKQRHRLLLAPSA